MSKIRHRDNRFAFQTEEEELNLRTCSIEVRSLAAQTSLSSRSDFVLVSARLHPTQELKEEVAKRQTAVLRPEKDSAEAKLTAPQRQLRVRQT